MKHEERESFHTRPNRGSGAVRHRTGKANRMALVQPGRVILTFVATLILPLAVYLFALDFPDVHRELMPSPWNTLLHSEQVYGSKLQAFKRHVSLQPTISAAISRYFEMLGPGHRHAIQKGEIKVINRLWYTVPVLPAREGVFPLGSHCSVSEAIAHAHALLLEGIAALEPSTASLSFVLDFTPGPSEGPRRTCLNLYLCAVTETDHAAATCRRLIEKGALRTYYPFRPCRPPNVAWDLFESSCDIVRFCQIRRPTTMPGENWRLPSILYEDRPLRPNVHNDYMDLDHLMYGSETRVVIQMCVEPWDAFPQRAGLSRYCAVLTEANRGHEQSSSGVSHASWRDTTTHGRRRRLNLPHKRDPVADEVLRTMQNRGQELAGPHLMFHCRVLGENARAVRQTAATVAECAFLDGSYQLVTIGREEKCFPAIVASCRDGRVSLVPTPMQACMAEEPALYKPLAPLPQLASVEELEALCRFPIGSSEPPFCFRQSTDPPDIPLHEMVVLGHDLNLCAEGMPGPARGIRKADLPKSVMVFGMPGTGKGVLQANIAFQLHQDGIPFILIAPIAAEHLAIKLAKGSGDPATRRFAEDLKVFTPGRDAVSPFLMNPLLRYPWVRIEEHIERLMECFRGSMEVFVAFDGVLHEALDELYRDFPDAYSAPTMADLVDSTLRVLDRKGYQGEVSGNLHAAIDVRLRTMCRGSIGGIFETGINCPDMGELANSFSVIDLEALPKAEKSRFILFFLKSLREYIAHQQTWRNYVRIVVIVDEAHLVAGPSSTVQASEES
ncbi:MAG: hypothetical protein KJ052_07655 [Candidatus Hydrogenedentes bacterium]|nr:hypothetical protein [Candidatus Hydrogenedentota bacterium]